MIIQKQGGRRRGEGEIVLSLPSSFYYSLINNNRDLLQTGTLSLAVSREGEEEGMFLQVGHFVIGIESDWVVVLVEYQDTIAYYLIDSVDNLTVLVVEKGNPDTLNFKEYLKAMLPFLEGEEVWENGRVKSVLDTHWELYLERAPVNADGFQKFISSTGHVVGKGIVTVGSKISSYWNRNNQPAGEIEETSWFKRCKQKAKRWLGRTSKAMKPVVDPLVNKGKEVNEKIGDKIDQGDSEIMKYIKDVASISSEAIRNIYLGAKAAARGEDTFYSESNAPTNYRQSSPQKPRASEVQNSLEDSSLDLFDKQGIRDDLLDK